MRVVDLIARKRDGLELTEEEIHFLIEGVTKGSIPDYQISAWLMAVVLQGMTPQETTALTLAMARSGETLNLKEIAPVVVDKHSSGGVGDKTSLVVGPLVASLGLPVGKMSGRGLGFSGGTLDKLESIPGFRATLSKEEFLAQLKTHGLVIAGQSADLAPADGKLYALRDVTATVESIPLIASSIMSKKIAAGADAIVLDVKVGSGAFMKTIEQAQQLAETMVTIGRLAGRKVTAIISDMSQPLGNAVGNALEVKEAIATLRREGPVDFLTLCLTVAAQMLILAGRVADEGEAKSLLLEALVTGRAFAKFREFVIAQGGDPAVLENPDQLPKARHQEPLIAPCDGYLESIDAAEVGLAVAQLGGGRLKKGDPIDHAVGVVFNKKVGDRVRVGETVLTIHANDPFKLEQAYSRLIGALRWDSLPVPRPDLIHQIIS